jgi:hypothetical protein
LISIVIVQIWDGILSKMFCPAPPMKIVIIHTLDLIINYYIARFVGYEIILYLMTLI